MSARSTEPADTASFLVIDAGPAAWGVDIAHVDSVLDAGAADDAIDAATLGAPADRALPPRVLRLRTGAVAVRGKLVVVTIPRAEIQPLPPLVIASMQQHAFGAVALPERDDSYPPFLILDVTALGRAS